MSEPLDVFVVVGKENYDGVGHAQTYGEAALLGRKFAKDGTVFVHSQTTGRRTFFTASKVGIVQLPGKPRDSQGLTLGIQFCMIPRGADAYTAIPKPEARICRAM